MRLFVSAALLLLLAAPSLAQEGPASAVLTILHVNDIDRMEPSEDRGGVAKVASVVEDEAGRADHVLVTLGGDLISPSLLSSIDKGAHMVRLANEIGIDYAVPGNHEFDFGPAVARQRLSEARFTWLSSNIREKDGTPLAGTEDHALVAVGPFKVGLFGITTPETPLLSSPGPDLMFEKAAPAAERAVAALREAGADLVVMVAHEGLVANRLLLDAVDGIDVVLGGHDHLAVAYYDGIHAVMSAGSQGGFVGVMEITLRREDADGNPVTSWTPQMRLVSTEGLPEHPALAAMVGEYESRLDAELGQPIGRSEVPLDTRRTEVRGRETRFGNLVADAMRARMNADLAVTNGGGIRGDRTYPAGTELTRRDILAELPFGNTVLALEVTGATIEAALENGVSQMATVAGRFPQVSGLRFVVDADAPVGERVDGIEVGGAPLDPEATYRLATNDFVARGGDGYAMFESARRLVDAKDGPLLSTVVADHVAAAGTVAPVLDGRIRIDR